MIYTGISSFRRLTTLISFSGDGWNLAVPFKGDLFSLSEHNRIFTRQAGVYFELAIFAVNEGPAVEVPLRFSLSVILGDLRAC